MAQQPPISPMSRTISASKRTIQLTQHLHRMATPAPQPAAPWRSLFLDHISKLSPPTFTLSTLHPNPSSSSSSSSSSFSSAFRFTPRARTVVYRGMFASLPVNPKNPAKLNPEGVWESDLLTITSDARMEKIPELFSSGREDGNGTAEEGAQSGEGGPFEAVFWVDKANTQWRIRGHAVVIGPDIDSSSHDATRKAILAHMRQTSSSSSLDSPSPDFSFPTELTAHFGNLSPAMRGTFRNPPPGTPLTDRSSPPDSGLGLGQKVDDLDDKIARANFRVVVLVPEEVDQVDLGDPDEGKRWNYSLQGSEETRAWKVTELWP
ncbi:hypothetical protein NLU13_4857 [Sarocladium strictum]|uniref:Pyridoxamine 5'-phosphate oxidase Alr4036 family FMN-binding domain-containing protein n=1 Tax=Sarocladium strictum TaxID=5046 RepID=A0AA39GLE1_SARSR|nr:hypothetical protein NLU13_4857 [Sarocladium strictum]